MEHIVLTGGALRRVTAAVVGSVAGVALARSVFNEVCSQLFRESVAGSGFCGVQALPHVALAVAFTTAGCCGLIVEGARDGMVAYRSLNGTFGGGMTGWGQRQHLGWTSTAPLLY